MQIQLLSDLHMELDAISERGNYDLEIPVNAQHLALLGDIGWSREPKLFEWLKAQLSRFETVFFLSGNHEHYHSSISASHERFKAFEDETASNPSLGKFVYLNRTRYDMSPDLTILGCTLWSSLDHTDLDLLVWTLNDFRHIYVEDRTEDRDSVKLTPEAYDQLHQSDLTWLNETVAHISSHEPGRRIVVFSHHAPVTQGTSDPRFDNEPKSSAFASDLTGKECWTAGGVSAWAFGHTHWCCDFERDGIRVYSNQRGNYAGAHGFDCGKVIDL